MPEHLPSESLLKHTVLFQDKNSHGKEKHVGAESANQDDTKFLCHYVLGTEILGEAFSF